MFVHVYIYDCHVAMIVVSIDRRKPLPPGGFLFGGMKLENGS